MKRLVRRIAALSDTRFGRIVARGCFATAVVLALVFLYSGIEKFGDLSAFGRVVASHGLLSGRVASSAATGVALLEVMIGGAGLGLLVLGGWRVLPMVLLMQASMFLLFAVYAAVLSIVPPPEPTSCGCGLLASGPADWPAILSRSVVIASALCAAAWWGAGCGGARREAKPGAKADGKGLASKRADVLLVGGQRV